MPGNEITSDETLANDLASVVHCKRLAVTTTEGSKIDHPFSLRRRERPEFVFLRVQAEADDLSGIVDRCRNAHVRDVPPERAAIDWDEWALCSVCDSRVCGQ